MPSVSVIIPAYNRALVIAQTLQSVVDQTYADWECIVVDDGSTDDTAAVVQRFVDADSRFRLIRQANANAAGARNRAVAEARGEFLAFLDSDDLFEPDKLAWQVERLRQDPSAVLVYGESIGFSDEDPARGGVVFSRLVEKPQGPPPAGFEGLLTMNPIMAPLVRTSAFNEAGGFDTSFSSAEDWDMWLSLARRGTVIHERRQAVRYRLHEGPSGNKSAHALRNYQCARRIIAKHMRHVPLMRRAGLWRALRDYWRHGYLPRLLREADAATDAGDWPRARQLWRAAVGLDPRLLLKHHHIRVNYGWSLLPTQREPIWRRGRARSIAQG
jgi:glycosyltransferase involved in cell wall biosynthesis